MNLFLWLPITTNYWHYGLMITFEPNPNFNSPIVEWFEVTNVLVFYLWNLVTQLQFWVLHGDVCYAVYSTVIFWYSVTLISMSNALLIAGFISFHSSMLPSYYDYCHHLHKYLKLIGSMESFLSHHMIIHLKMLINHLNFSFAR